MTPENEKLILSTLDQISRQSAAIHNLLFPRSKLSVGDEDGMGFIQFSQAPHWVYIGETEGSESLWYFVVEDKRVPIKEEALVGKLKRLFGVKRLSRGRTSYKLCAEVDCGTKGTFILQSGIDTHYTKGLVSSLENADDATLFGPIAITLRPGDSEKVIFAQVFSMPHKTLLKNGVTYSNSTQVVEGAVAVCAKLGVPWEVNDYTA